MKPQIPAAAEKIIGRLCEQGYEAYLLSLIHI